MGRDAKFIFILFSRCLACFWLELFGCQNGVRFAGDNGGFFALFFGQAFVGCKGGARGEFSYGCKFLADGAFALGLARGYVDGSAAACVVFFMARDKEAKNRVLHPKRFFYRVMPLHLRRLKNLGGFYPFVSIIEASIQRGFWKRHKRGLGFFTCFLILTSLPIGINLLLRPSAFTARLGNVSITHDMKEAKSVLPLVENVIRHAGMFHYYSDPNVRHHLPDVPLLDFISGFFMALGLGIAIWGIRKPKNRFLLLWLLFALMGGIFSLRAEAPQSYRTGASAPAAFALCGIGFAGLLKWLAKTFQSRRVMISSFMVAILGLSGGINFHRYFLQYPRVKTLWTQFWGAEQTFQSRYLEKRSRTGKAILLDDAYGSNYFFVFTAARRIIMNVEPDFYNPYRPTENLPAGDVEIYFPPFRFDVYKAIASPERIRAVNSPNGEAVFYCANLSHRELKTAAAIEPWQNQTRGDGRVLFNARLILPEDYFSTMKLESPTSATLTIDGRAMLCPDDGERVIPLKKGVHGIEIVQESAPRLPEFKLLWRPDYEHLEEIPASFLLP